MAKKTLWRCNICNDVHYGFKPPQICPTCQSRNAFIRIDHEEAWKIIGDIDEAMTSEDDVIRAWYAGSPRTRRRSGCYARASWRT
jgi:hypothetical protein